MLLCASCGGPSDGSERFCRKCGANLWTVPNAHGGKELLQTSGSGEGLKTAAQKDPDELTGNGVASVFIGDGFFMVSVILSATQTSISSLLWLLLLIPAFFFFGKGFRDLWQARQIRRRLRETELTARPAPFELESGSPLLHLSRRHRGELLSGSSVTERTTRQLE
jgi:hypothetical protein